MQNSNNVCRFCLELVYDANVELINRVTKEMLAVLLIKLDLDMNEDPLACKRCMTVLEEFYTFKSKCLYSEDIINAHCESNLKVNLMDILIELENKSKVKIAKDEVVCRLCIKIPPNGSFIALNESGEEVSRCIDMIQMQLPEINLNDTEEPIICEKCHVQLKNYSSFATSCMYVEQKIKMYCEQQGSDIRERVDLLCVLQSTENKVQNCDDIFNGDLIASQGKSFAHVKVEKVEEDKLSKDHGSVTEYYIKEEEVQIKSEDDQISCGQYTYPTNLKGYQLGHKRKHHKSYPKVIFQCNHCNYLTNNNRSLTFHKKTHDPAKYKLKCEQCEYSTYFQYRLKKHLLTHTELGQTRLYYCGTCKFRSRYKKNLTEHLKCCSKGNDDSRVMLQCDQCDYRTKTNRYLNSHKKMHNPTKYKLKCEQCEFSTYRRSTLNRHLVTHKELGATEVYSCAICDFKSKYKKSLKDHLKKCSEEDNTDSRVTLECDQCDFRTKWTKSLFLHKKRHDPTKYKFKCEQCQYCTTSQSFLNRHLVRHMNLGEAVVYFCATCYFKTKYKHSLIYHVNRCGNRRRKV